MIYVTADTHFGHMKLCEYEHRPKGFNDQIIKNWNSVVNDGDTVIHCGDFCLGRHGDYSYKETVGYWRDRLYGDIVLVLGNHDKYTAEWYVENGFKMACNSLEMTFRGQHILFTHRPLYNFSGIEYVCDERNHLTIKDVWDLNIHGHCHGNSHREGGKTEKHIDIGWDVQHAVVPLKSLV